jgi:hypothetical protein
MAEDVDRRAFLALGGGLLLGGCGVASTARGARTTSATATSTTPTTRTPRSGTPPTTRAASPAPLPRVRRWQPSPNDIEPRAKLAAVRTIEARGNGSDRALQVIDAQYGGILTDSASVLVVCRSWRRTSGHVIADGATYDVRLSLAGTRWRVTAIHPSHPGARADVLSPVATRVLGHPRIDLPPAARADVGSGQVHTSVLSAMLRLAETYRIGVSVVRSGHPIYVFGTTRLSDHPRGRAFDTWRINGKAVIDPGTGRRLVAGYMEAAAAAGSYNVGGPYLLGPAPQFFSDNTHHDHVHAGFLT